MKVYSIVTPTFGERFAPLYIQDEKEARWFLTEGRVNEGKLDFVVREYELKDYATFAIDTDYPE